MYLAQASVLADQTLYSDVRDGMECQGVINMNSYIFKGSF